MAVRTELNMPHPLGTADRSMGVLGSVGVDARTSVGKTDKTLPVQPNKDKYGVSFDELDTMATAYDVIIHGKTPSGTALGFASGAAKNQELFHAPVRLIAPISTRRREQKLVGKIRDVVEDTPNLKLTEVPYDGRTPLSFVFKHEDGKNIFTAKPDLSDIEEFPDDINALVLGPLGNFVGTYNNAQKLGIPLGVIGGSLIGRLNTRQARDAYFGALDASGAFFGNDDEVRDLLKVADIVPNKDPIKMARQLQRRFNIPFLIMSRGKDGVTALVGEEDVFNLHVNLPIPKHKVVDVTGSGDALAGAVAAQGRRGLNPENVIDALEAGTNSAMDTLMTPDSLTGQLRLGGVRRHEHRYSTERTTHTKLAKAATIVDLGKK